MDSFVKCELDPSMSTDTMSPGPAPIPVPSTSQASDHTRQLWPRSSVPPTAAASSSLTAPVAAAENQVVSVGSPAIPPSPLCYVNCEPDPSMSTETMSPGPAPIPVPIHLLMVTKVTINRSSRENCFSAVGWPRSSVPPTAAASSSFTAPVAAAENQAVSVGSPAIPPSPPCFVMCEPDASMSTDTMSPGPAPIPVPSTLQASDHARQLTRREAQHPAKNAEIAQLAMGNEQESGSDDEPVPVLSRQKVLTIETLMNTPRTVGDYMFSCLDPEEPEMPYTAASLPAGPNCMYEFIWRNYPDSPIPPESRREMFSQSNVGPTLPVDTPYDAFIAIWDRPIIETIVRETNKYARHLASIIIEENAIHPGSRICDWYDTCVDEIYLFLALVLTMGVVIKSRIDDYWNKEYVMSGFSSIMSLGRFQVLCKCLHFSDNEGMIGLNLDRDQAKLYKIAPVVDHLNKKFQELYVLDRNIVLDESLLQWKGSLNINQHIPNKRAKTDIKSYELCESQTGYLWRFQFHAHQRDNYNPYDDPMTAPTSAIVLKLVQGLENKGYTLWMGNYYNSPALARKLKTMGFDCVGTLRTNRKFVPMALTNLSKRKMRPGQITGFTSGDVDLLVWRGQNRVAAISTYHGKSARVVRGKRTPVLIHDYNTMVDGVDKKDQMLATYPIMRKITTVWYKQLFLRLLNVSVLNAYIINKGSDACSHNAHRDFRWALINSLIEHNTVTK